jgi:glutamine amidotransferase
MIGIIDYGAGNLVSVQKAFEYLGARAAVIRRPHEVKVADRLVLPGVGHFVAMAALQVNGTRDAVLDAIFSGKPFLGICLGMQWLFDGSEEAPEISGAGLFPGRCRALPKSVKSPHVGWNTIEVRAESRLLRGLESTPFLYFTHSFAAPIGAGTTAVAQYGGPLAAAVECANIFGVQFHPEKSGHSGLKILRSFCEI